MGKQIWKSSLILALLCAAGCASGMRVPTDESMRASLNPAALTNTTSASEETDTQVRATILDKIRLQLRRDGQYPITAIQQAELLSLTPSFSEMAPENSTWNYQAVARVNLKASSIKIRYMIFDRDGELVVRKIST